MNKLFVPVILIASVWMTFVGAYTMYECGLEAKGLEPASTFPFREEFLRCLNSLLPLTLVCLVLLWRMQQTAPICPGTWRLCLIMTVLGTFLTFSAKERAYPDPADPSLAEAVWWLPDPDPAQVEGTDF